MVVVNMMIGFTVDWFFSDTKRFKNKPHNALQWLYAVSLLDCHNVTSTKAWWTIIDGFSGYDMYMLPPHTKSDVIVVIVIMFIMIRAA